MQSPMALPTPTPGKEREAFAVRSWSGRKTYNSKFFDHPQPPSVSALAAHDDDEGTEHEAHGFDADDAEFAAAEGESGDASGDDSPREQPSDGRRVDAADDGGFGAEHSGHEDVVNIVEWGRDEADDGARGALVWTGDGQVVEPHGAAGADRDFDDCGDLRDDDRRRCILEEEQPRVNAQERHREMLESMAMKKAAAKADLDSAQEREKRHRVLKNAKFAEANAARRLRQEPSYLVATAATAAHFVVKEAAPVEEEDPARVEKIIATRRRQKEQYRALLFQISQKKRHEADRTAQRSDLDEAFRKKVKEAAAALRSKELLKDEAPQPETSPSDAAPQPRTSPPAQRKLAPPKDAPPKDAPATAAHDDLPTPRGSAFSAARSLAGKPAAAEDEDPAQLALNKRIAAALRDKQSEYFEKVKSERKQHLLEAEAKAADHKRRLQLRREKLLRQSSRRAATANQENDGAADDDDTDGKKKADLAQQRSAIDRLTSVRSSSTAVAPAARDFSDWKRKHGVSANQRVFVITGWYPCVKDALLRRGWAHNEARDSPYFDLKWTLNSIDLSSTALEPWQMTNHFRKTRGLVTKLGLAQSLDQLTWHAKVGADAIFPRCYDLSNMLAAKAFIDDYRGLEALRLLRCLVGLAETGAELNCEVFRAAFAGCEKRLGLTALDSDSDVAQAHWELVGIAAQAMDQASGQTPASGQAGPAPHLGRKTAKKAKKASKAKKAPSDDAVLAQQFAEAAALRSALARPVHLPVSAALDSVVEPIFLAAHEKELRAEHAGSDKAQTVAAAELKRHEARRAKGIERSAQKERDCIVRRSALPAAALSAAQVSAAVELIAQLSATPQDGLDGGAAAMNLWIVKPAAKSRGRGIRTFRRLGPLLEYCDMVSPDHRAPPPAMDDFLCPDLDEARLASKQAPLAAQVPKAAWKPGGSQWIVQKYLEKQLLIAKRKFDLRQWVLVTSWNPLTIWFYDECYARFSGEEYTTDEEALSNDFVHLVNNSISKKSDAFHEPVLADNGLEVVDCMWTLAQLREYLQFVEAKQGPFPSEDDTRPPSDEAPANGAKRPSKVDAEDDDGADAAAETDVDAAGEADETNVDVDDGDAVQDVFARRVRPRMRRIAKWALMAASETVEHRPNSWELYGFDFMLDDTAKPWLIEVNSSPACDYSTTVTADFVQRALLDILKVNLDYAPWAAAHPEASPADADAPDVGQWRQIYRGPTVETPITAFGGSEIVAKGQRCATPRDYKRARAQRRDAAALRPRPAAARPPGESDDAPRRPSPNDEDDERPPPPPGDVDGDVDEFLLDGDDDLPPLVADTAAPPTAAADACSLPAAPPQGPAPTQPGPAQPGPAPAPQPPARPSAETRPAPPQGKALKIQTLSFDL
ncbi:tubulin-tyrosine ligase family-domain-containing protein [Pelagophyceae sp. CCMP2097]|nr:tubulin-tyrosine ligase family-domain-containing protein [Pelagophyceae sp. CCMP2097]